MAIAALVLASQVVFGIPLGQPVSLPMCEGTENNYRLVQETTCRAEVSNNQGESWQTQRIVFALKTMPAIVRDASIDAMIIDGAVAGLRFKTRGIETQSLVMEELTRKFGKPTIQDTKKTKTRAGVEFTSITALWQKPDVSVTFLGTLGRIDEGLVIIDSPDGNVLRNAALKAQSKQQIQM